MSLGSLTGRVGEFLAREYLRRQGMEHVASNWRYQKEEIDLIMRQGETLVFVEVKTRRLALETTAYEAVDRRKQEAISRVALAYISQNHLFEVPVRFDVVIISGDVDDCRIRHIPDAFEFQRGNYFI